MEANKFSPILIDGDIIMRDCVITKFMDNGLRITPLEWYQKSNVSFCVHAIITFDTNKEQARVLRDLSDGALSYDDLVKTYF